MIPYNLMNTGLRLFDSGGGNGKSSAEKAEMPAAEAEEETPESLEAQFRELIQGKYKEAYAKALAQDGANRLHEQRTRELELKRRWQVDAWIREAEAMRGTRNAPGEYPDLNLVEELRDPQFVKALEALTRAGFSDPLRRAYESVHMADIKGLVAKQSAESAERRLVGNIQAKGARPVENGGASSAITVKPDVNKLSKAERAEIAKRVARGERISF